jgi:hypothetical protein
MNVKDTLEKCQTLSSSSLLIRVLDLYQEIATDSSRLLMIVHDTIGKGDDTLLKLTINDRITLNQRKIQVINSLLVEMEFFTASTTNSTKH